MKTVFVGLSGGVDSSVSAYLLKEAKPNNFQKLFGRPTPKGFRGYNVVGVFIKIWQPEFLDVCTWKEDRRSAMQVAAHLDIPFITIDLSEEYKRGVVDYMIKEYSEGRTPNPDVMCNREIKFKAFLNKALEMGADYIATGHYARVATRKLSSDKSQVSSENTDSLSANDYQLLTAHDSAKEQSYFLWTLGQHELSKTLFPIGGLPKKEVRRIAEKAGLHTFEKKDSQGLCFIGKVDFKEFLKSFIETKKGDVLNEEGKVIGYHDGVAFLTIGERHGFTITEKSTDDKPLYVIDKNISNNTVTVAEKEKLAVSNLEMCEFVIKDTNWISGLPEKNKKYDGQVRYHQDYQKCTVEVLNDGEARLSSPSGSVNGGQAKVTFDNPQTGAKGQSIVVYDGDECLGGGIIK